MEIEIKKYNHSEEYHRLLKVIKSEGEEWKEYFNSKYQEVLKHSITYVAYIDNELCGYSRSINDHGLYLLVIDLLVAKKHRGHSIGRKLLEILSTNYPNQDIFVLSDVDGYYQKIGYRKEGSIFKIE